MKKEVRDIYETLKFKIENGDQPAQEHISNDTIHVTQYNKNQWNAKYAKPVNGIPESDLSSDSQTKLAKGNTALQGTDVVDNYDSTATNKPVSARIAKELNDRINALSENGRFLSFWNCTTGIATTEPPVNPYDYRRGDFFIVAVVASEGGTNYKPYGAEYDKDTPSSEIETRTVHVNDVYKYDGTVWDLLSTDIPTMVVDTDFDSTSTNPVENRVITAKIQELEHQHPITMAVTIPVSAWDSTELTATIVAHGVTSTDYIIGSPTPESMEEALGKKVFMTGQNTDSLTFSCEEVPESAVAFNVVVIPAMNWHGLSSITVTGTPATQYVGFAPDMTGLTVTANYDDGDTMDVSAICIVTPSTWETEGTQDMTITYSEGGVTRQTTVEVSVEAVVPVSIAISGTPATQTVGSAPDTTGLTVTATNNDGSTEDVTSSCTWTPASWTTTGTDTLTATYQSLTDSIEVTVEEPAV